MSPLDAAVFGAVKSTEVCTDEDFVVVVRIPGNREDRGIIRPQWRPQAVQDRLIGTALAEARQ